MWCPTSSSAIHVQETWDGAVSTLPSLQENNAAGWAALGALPLLTSCPFLVWFSHFLQRVKNVEIIGWTPKPHEMQKKSINVESGKQIETTCTPQQN